MILRGSSLFVIGAGLSVPVVVSCSSSQDEQRQSSGESADGGGAGGLEVTGTGTGGRGGDGVGGSMSMGGAPNQSGGTSGGGASANTGGTSSDASTGEGGAGIFVDGGTDTIVFPPLDCGANGAVVEDHGPTSNRVNYVIVGDGYSEAELDSTLDAHIQTAMAKRFSDPIGQVYLRYRNFVNICVLKIPSTPICGTSTFGCCGDDESRLADCDTQAVNDAIAANLPESFEVDWRAVVLNGDRWWNTGSQLMLWSGGNPSAAGAALHEGGHGFHRLADEYGDCGSDLVNNTTDGMTSGGKWDAWIGYDQIPGTGVQGFFACEGGYAYRPSGNSMMNSLFGDDPDTSYNAVSREKMIMDIWRIIENPWDAVEPPEGAVTNPTSLTLHLIDPAVIDVDWSVDGEIVAVNGGPTYAIGAAGLAPGTYAISARAYDNAGTDLVRQTSGTLFNRRYWATNASKTVTWTVTIQ